MEINEDLELDIENKYIKYKEATQFSINEIIYILRSRDYSDEVENIAIDNLINRYFELLKLTDELLTKEK